MNEQYITEDNNSVTEVSANGQTYGNMSVASESGFNSSADGYDNRKKSNSSIQEQDVAKHEQQAVNRSKLVVALFLLLAACASAAGTYLFVEQQERKDFEDQFHSYATEFVAVTRQKTDQLFNALNSFSVSVSSEAKATNQSWPFVTISDYSTKVRLFAELIDVPGATMAFLPVVNGADHVQWATHTMEDARGYFQNAINTEAFDMTVDELMALTTPLVHYYDEENG
ncbi:unnamed protein product [Cylindrotheca closterium]|uniref:Uncharacterized protein n=1 Tax=Cylindrotheca closterium TaxID=2856 RepID=A0AAD2CLA2_9STRA|nr:unnamed protein product [Cylindrotheca closterium]